MTAKYAFVSAERSHHVVTTLCRVVGVRVSGFYAWLRAIPGLHVNRHWIGAHPHLRCSWLRIPMIPDSDSD